LQASSYPWPKQGCTDCAIFLNRFAKTPKEKSVRRWLIVLLAVAVLATIAGFITFGGADMGR
jgi:hypothetical protein